MEVLLKEAGERGLSIKQLSEKLNVPNKTVKYLIYNSKYVKDTDPYLHGSFKTKIRCFTFTEQNKTYIQKKYNIKVQEPKVQEPKGQEPKSQEPIEKQKIEKEWVIV